MDIEGKRTERFFLREMIKCLTNVEIMQKSLHILDDELISELKKTNVLVYRIMISCTLRNALN